jgi:hypothetical protein
MLYFRVFCDRNVVDIIIWVYNFFFLPLSTEYSLHIFGRMRRNDVFVECTADFGPFQNIDMSDRNIFIADVSGRVAGWLPLPIVIRRRVPFSDISPAFFYVTFGIPKRITAKMETEICEAATIQRSRN